MYSEMHSGTFFNLANPSVDDVKIGDIAHHLSLICRFNGGTDDFYSVAEHSLMCRYWLEHKNCSTEEQLVGLLHDGHEAYTGDLTTGFKKMLGVRYEQIVWALDEAIGKKFGVSMHYQKNGMVWLADQVMLTVEAHWMMPSGGEGEHWSRLVEVSRFEQAMLRPQKLSPVTAERLFLEEYNRLVCKLKREQKTVASYAR